jgi:hypothetical protein
MAQPAVPAPERRRPLGVIVVAAVQFARAGLVIVQLFGRDLFPDSDWLRAAVQIPDPAPSTVAFAISRGLGAALVAASIAIGIGLLGGRRWAWVGAIILSGLSLAFAIGAWWDGHPQYLAMAINVVAVFYLNQREVRSTFEDAPVDSDERAEHVVGA